MTPSPWACARRLLAVCLDALGDVLMTTPALRALKESKPGRHVTLLTSMAGAEAARFVPEVDQIITYHAPWMKATNGQADCRADDAVISRLRESRFDAAVIFTVYSQNPLPAAYLCYLAGIPLRLAHCRENPYQLLTDWIPECEPDRRSRHEVRRQLDLVATVGCHTHNEQLSFQVPSRSRLRARRLLDAIGVDHARPWVAVHPGASAPSRRYPPELFAEAASILARDDDMQIVFTGGPRECELVESIRSLLSEPSASLAGRLGLDDLGAVISLTPVLLANNTGPVHIAAAVGTPVVVLYALTNPQHTPWGVPHRVLSHDVPCRNCYKSVCPEGHHDCLRRIAPREVAAAVREIVGAPDFALRSSATAREAGSGRPV
jgi:lipopolysaccharide heptosyltransferase II